MKARIMFKRAAAASTILISIAGAYLYGVISHRDRLPPFPQILWIKNHLFPDRIGFSDTRGRIEIPCASLRGGRTMVALAFGQSNAGNHGETLYRPAKPVYNYYRGRCYEAADPLLGPTGDAGTVWTRLADRCIRSGLYDRVLIIPIAVGTTTVSEWAPGGYLNRLLVQTIRDVSSLGLTITHCFWIQGQSEDSVGEIGSTAVRDRYIERFTAMVKGMRELGVRAPVFVAISTISHKGFNPAVQEAQRMLVNPALGILPGPDYDDIMKNPNNRWEEVHLSHQGLELATHAWLKALTSERIRQ